MSEDNSNKENILPQDQPEETPVVVEELTTSEPPQVEIVEETANTDGQPMDVDDTQPKEQEPASEPQLQEQQPEQSTDPGNDLIQEEPHTSFLQPPASEKQFTTPSKDLPALKDIEPITTPKTFDVAKDNKENEGTAEGNNELEEIVASSPIKHNILADLETHNEETVNEESLRAIAGYLSLDESSIRSINNPSVLQALVSKSVEFQNVSSENEFLKLKLEQNAQSIGKQLDDLKQKYSQSDNLATTLTEEKEKLQYKFNQQQQDFTSLKETKDRIEKELLQLKTSEPSKDEELNKLRDAQGQFEIDFQQQINQLSSTNISQSKKLNELTKEINETRNDKFSLQLDLTKAQNEVAYLKDQKDWFDNELKSAQARFTDLIKKHESEYIATTSNISNLQVRNETLENLKKQHESTISELRAKLEQELTKTSKTETEFELEKSRFLKEITSKEELIELTKLQSQQRVTRIEQLESYIEEIKESLGNTITSLEARLSEETERLLKTEEKLRRTEEMLDAELHKETDLPKLSDSSAMIAANGISLSSLYSEYNHLKKQLVLERSQKQKMEVQLESFITELDARKPAIANYREQIQFYESSMKEMIGKVETIRSEKTEVEKDAKRLRTIINENENELVSMKKLLKDLGRQLCFYLIHSKIRDNNENPLTASEKKAIERILDQSGRFNGSDQQEFDTDKLISERLLEFRNIIELRQKNEELLIAIRNLSKQLESREEENNNLESVAIEEAKDAILTLESELDSLNIKLDAVTKERDAIRSINGRTTSDSNNSFLAQINEDLKKKVNDYEDIISKLRDESSKTVVTLNEKLREVTDQKNEFALKVSVSDKSAELAKSRLAIAQKSLDDSRQELAQVRKEIEFWKQQTSKLESSLVAKTEQLHQLEETVSAKSIALTSLEREKDFKQVIQSSLQNEIDALKQDKTKLNEFVLNLQTMLRDREESAKDISSKLNASIENYQSLQQKLSEKEERISILSNQSELSLKAQNAKLEQVNEISRQLLETKSLLAEKENVVDELKKKLASRRDTIVAPLQAAVPGATTTGNDTNNNFEIQQLKEDLRIAESQVEELSNLAKASETTLINATNSFEQYRQDSEAKYQALAKEKETIEGEVKRLNELYETTNTNLEVAKTEHLTELNNLKLQLNEFKYKSDQYDELDKDYKEKLESIRKDLEDQVKLADESHTKYLTELSKNVTLSEQISALKDKIESKEAEIKAMKEEVESSKKSIQEQQDKLSVEKSQIETDLSMSNNKIAELKEQNQLLLNQLELTKNSESAEATTGSENTEDLRQVINYLRREKDSSDAKLLVATHENQELKIRLTNVENQIAATSTTFNNTTSVINLDARVQEQKELSAQLEQLNILKESNNSLRQENTKLSEEIGKLHVEVDNLRKELDPLKVENDRLTTELAFAAQKVQLIEEENQRYKTSATSTDEEKAEEVKKLNDSIARKEDQMNRLKEKANQKVMEKIAVINEREASIKQLNEKVEELNAKIEELGKSAGASGESKEEVEKLKQQIDELSKKLKGVTDELHKVVEEKNGLLGKLSEVETNLRTQFEKEKQELKKTLESSQTGNATVNKDLQQNYNALLDRVVEEKKQFEAQLQTETAKAREETEKMYQMKIRMLDKKIKKYEEGMKKTPTSVPSKPQPATATTAGAATTTTTTTTTTPAAPKSTSGSPTLGNKPVARPLGHPGNESTLKVVRPSANTPFNESTLTVHQPSAAKKFSPAPTGGAQQETRKRANDHQQHRPQVKKPKE
ncbi:Protein MLP1 [Candida viswanathii]|uniref:Protein MLP1 n=1 Tax=Candida viswanathii TaxID=5486 RepID=A0A367Y0Z9_9ASCO|nr:Protein MLP1 [Candida viswanathii]